MGIRLVHEIGFVGNFVGFILQYYLYRMFSFFSKCHSSSLVSAASTDKNSCRKLLIII